MGSATLDSVSGFDLPPYQWNREKNPIGRPMSPRKRSILVISSRLLLTLCVTRFTISMTRLTRPACHGGSSCHGGYGGCTGAVMAVPAPVAAPAGCTGYVASYGCHGGHACHGGHSCHGGGGFLGHRHHRSHGCHGGGYGCHGAAV